MKKNYFTTEKEILSKRSRQYLLQRKFKIKIEHEALKWLHNVKDPSSRLLRWLLRLEEYEYETEYKKKKENIHGNRCSLPHPSNKNPKRSRTTPQERINTDLYQPVLNPENLESMLSTELKKDYR